MPPKGKAVAGSSQSFDSSKFLSYETQKKYTDQTKIHVIQERGLVQKLQPRVNWTITANQWEILCEHPDPAVVPIVREFYANGKERDDLRVFVRGKWVKFDRTTINNYYGLSNLHDDQYQELLESTEAKWEEMKNALCKENVPWKRYQNGGLKSFPGQAMKKLAKIWHYFVCAKLQPTTNVSAVMKHRAALVYAIIEGMKIDIGLVIQNSIIHGFEAGIQGFPHPHLITELCKNARVKFNQKEEVKPPKGLIDDSVVVKIQSDNVEGEARPAGPSQPKAGTVNERLQHMEQLMQSQFTYINQYQHSMVQYMQSSNQTWFHMFYDCAHALNVDTNGWPAMPMFQPPPPPNPVPPPPPPPVDPNIQAQQEEEAALEADDPMRDL